MKIIIFLFVSFVAIGAGIARLIEQGEHRLLRDILFGE